MAIAAARLGLHCIAIGHVGNEIYGGFLLDILHDEGIGMVGMSKDNDFIDRSAASYETLLCWVLVDPLQRHGFCRYIFNPCLLFIYLFFMEVSRKLSFSKQLFCIICLFKYFIIYIFVKNVDINIFVYQSS